VLGCGGNVGSGSPECGRNGTSSAGHRLCGPVALLHLRQLWILDEPGDAGIGCVAESADLRGWNVSALLADIRPQSRTEEVMSAATGPHVERGSRRAGGDRRVSAPVPEQPLELLHGRRLFRLRAGPPDPVPGGGVRTLGGRGRSGDVSGSLVPGRPAQLVRLLQVAATRRPRPRVDLGRLRRQHRIRIQVYAGLCRRS